MIFRRIGRAIRRVVNVGKNIFKTVKRTVSDIIKNPLAAVRKVLDKIPLPNVIKNFAASFLKSPLSLLLPAPIAAIASMVSKAGTIADIFDIVKGVTSSPAFQSGPPAARSNLMEMIAAQHARIIFPQMFN